jgi:hypothetical protein
MTLVLVQLWSVCLPGIKRSAGALPKKCPPESHILGEAFKWGERRRGIGGYSRSINEPFSSSFWPARFGRTNHYARRMLDPVGTAPGFVPGLHCLITCHVRVFSNGL